MSLGDGARPTPGALALLGSGEYTDAMNATDRALLDTRGGVAGARVALLPTASGREAGGPAYWNDLGQRHFAALGAGDIRPTAIVDAASAADPQQLALLRDADLYYFSGGDPQHLIATLRGSPAWEVIQAAHAAGAALAGCSAGAMALSARTLSVRQVMRSGAIEWAEALGVVPRTLVFPHFDRMAGFMGEERFRDLLAALPEDFVALGIDEDTALVCLTPDTGATGTARWQVMGRQTVTVFAAGEPPRTLRAGDELSL
jgi:cyanophycinase-like exopeptidase